MNRRATFVISFLLVTCVTGDQSREVKGETQTGKAASDVMDVSDFSVYYDMETNETIKKMMPRPWYRPGWPLRLPFSGGPCTCESLQCTCCSGIRIPVFNFDRKVCSKITYNNTDSMIDIVVTMNGNKVFNSSYSARNPPPFCVPIPVPYLPPGLVDLCVRLFDISVVEQKLHVCMDMDTRVDKAPVLVLHFDCMDMGFGGVGLSKPGNSPSPAASESSNVTNVSNAATTIEPDQVDADVYDPVEDKLTTTDNPYNISIKYT